jgi:PHP family Zn ribbon phosphoesterase
MSLMSDFAASMGAMGSGGSVLFKAACPDCRARLELSAEALRLAIGASHRTTFYSFTCPECGAAVRKPAGERIVELLTGGGVRTLRLQPAAPRL